MGFELDAFLGKASELREWKRELPSAVVCRLSGDLGLVPMIRELFGELRARPGQEEADRSVVTLQHTPYSSPVHKEVVRRWGAHASRNTTIAYVSASEYNDCGVEEAILWSNGKEMLSGVKIGVVILYLRDHAGIDIGEKCGDLDKYRGEGAAEKWAAAAILNELVDRSAKPVAGLIEALHYERQNKSIQNLVRQFAAHALGELGPPAAEALPALELTLKHEQDYGICVKITLALAAIGPEAVPALTSALTSVSYDRLWPILQALGEIGPAARQAVPVLMNILRDQIPHDFLGVRRGVAEILGKIGPEAGVAVPALIATLRDANWTVRFAAAAALGEICHDAPDAISALNDALNDDNHHVRAAAAQALAKVQSKGRQ